MHLPFSISQGIYGSLCTPPFRLKDVVYRRLVFIWAISIVIKNFL